MVTPREQYWCPFKTLSYCRGVRLSSGAQTGSTVFLANDSYQLVTVKFWQSFEVSGVLAWWLLDNGVYFVNDYWVCMPQITLSVTYKLYALWLLVPLRAWTCCCKLWVEMLCEDLVREREGENYQMHRHHEVVHVGTSLGLPPGLQKPTLAAAAGRC